MADVRLRFLGCGDAFGSGGRLQACLLLEGAGAPLLIDCGATSLQALRRERIDPSSVGSVALSHLHGDHFGGIPWLLLEGRFAKRTAPLHIAGPVGTEARVAAAFEALYPGAYAAERPFEVTFHEYAEHRPVSLQDAVITPFEVVHQSGAPSYGLRIEYGRRVIAYSGDTEWTDSLPDLARSSDLFVCECTFYDRRVPGHIDFHTLDSRRDQLGCRRLVVTHMSAQMLERAAELDVEAASDGLTVELR